jgi:hypothetical protein
LFDRWAYIIDGFLRHAGKRTRQIELWERLHTAGSPDFRAELRTWNHHWDAEAEFVFRMSTDQPKICIFAYSWGAGWGAMQFCKRLEARGVEVANLVLCDPVYRHWYTLGNWRAFVPWIPILIPCNVRKVNWLRQKTNWPRGHQLKAACNGATEIAEPFVLDCEHMHMSERMEYIGLCERVAAKTLGIAATPRQSILPAPIPVAVRKERLKEATTETIEQKKCGS